MAGVTAILKLLDWTPGSIIDIGVAHGTPGLYSVWPGVPICLIEPSPDSMPYMQEISARFPNVHIYNVGASDRSGEMTVRKHPAKVNIFFGDKPAWQETVIPLRTCDDMVADAGLAGPYLYKLDTDAHELEILKGSPATLARTDVVIIELNTFYGLRGLAPPNELWGYLHDCGFTFFDFGDPAYAENGILRAVDFAFVRKDSELFESAYQNSGKRKKTPAKKVAV
jgi:FkbM family methyltransferase